MNGWIKFYRKILENPIVCKDADHIAVWVYLLLNATHENYDGMFKGERITLEPGQLITGRKSISSFLKINENKVQRILKLFETEQQIEQQASNKNRLVTIVNWKSYQTSDTQDEQQLNNKRTTTEQQLNTNKNERSKEHKNERSKERDIEGVKPVRFVPPSLSGVEEYCKEKSLSVNPEKFVDYYTSNGWLVGKNKMKDWQATLRNWSRRDERSEKNETSKPVNQYGDFDEFTI